MPFSFCQENDQEFLANPLEMSREEATKLLLTKRSGTFLVRNNDMGEAISRRVIADEAKFKRKKDQVFHICHVPEVPIETTPH